MVKFQEVFVELLVTGKKKARPKKKVKTFMKMDIQVESFTCVGMLATEKYFINKRSTYRIRIFARNIVVVVVDVASLNFNILLQ